MERKTVSGITLTLLLAGMLILAFNIQPVKAGGTIYITSDYTFTQDIYEPIVVLADNIVIDGNGYTLQGTGSEIGINVTERSYVTIKNMGITGFRWAIHIVHSDHITIFENSLTQNGDELGSVQIWYSSFTIFSENHVTDGAGPGIYVLESSNNTISRNNISRNGGSALALQYSDHNMISENSMIHNCKNEVNGRTIGVNWSSNNTFSGNTIIGKKWQEFWTTTGIELLDSSDNKFYHNNFIDNDHQVRHYPGFPTSICVWDDGYPSGGNYWSDYVDNGGYDADGDGIGDIPYVIDASNQDNYPLMEPWSVPTMIKTLIRTIGFSDLPKGTEKSLTSKLHDAIHLLDKGNENGAIHKLMDFINQVEGLRNKKLTNGEADYLISGAQRIIDLIRE